MKAAEIGCSEGAFYVALSYQRGMGVEQSDEHCVYWYNSAAELGNHKAQVNLADIYQKGEIVSKIWMNHLDY